MEQRSEPEKTQFSSRTIGDAQPFSASAWCTTRRDSCRIPRCDHKTQDIGVRGLDGFGRVLACARLRQRRGLRRPLVIGLRCALAFRGEVEGDHRPPRLTARIAEIQAMINPAAYNRAVGEFRPISRPNDARIARSYVKQAIGIAAKRVIPRVRVHEVADAPPALKACKMLVFLTWYYIQYRAWGAISRSFGFPMNSGSTCCI
jgi:hypothetical protein